MNRYVGSSGTPKRYESFVIGLAVLAVVAIVYSPLHRAGLVWVDKIIFQDQAWLRVGDAWKHIIFHGFYEWVNYFRPLVVALFVFEERYLDASPQSMHLLSLGMHLVNTAMVGLLALRYGGDARQTRPGRMRAGLAMLLFGLHPAMIEPVSWISCQFEIVVTFFILLGLWVHASTSRSLPRALSVAACFFLAACAKESAVSFPLLLLLQDWMVCRPAGSRTDFAASVLAIWRRNWTTYALVFGAGIVYLVLREASLGFLISPIGHESSSILARLQTICFTYITYWRILVWPMTGLGPLHVVDMHAFAIPGLASLVADGAATAIIGMGTWLALTRRPAGALVLSVSAALLPVLHIVPVAFDVSLYHERYAMTALAVACAWLPCVLDDLANAYPWKRWHRYGSIAIAAIWLAMSIGNIRSTLPLWSDELKLWQWVLREQPDSIIAKAHLLSTYMNVEDYRSARALAGRLVAEDTRCANCLTNAAFLYLGSNDTARAEVALEKLKRLPELRYDKGVLGNYVLALGQLRQSRHDLAGAESAYRDAIALHPFDPNPVMQLALLLAQQGRSTEARSTFAKAMDLSPPNLRAKQAREFEAKLAHSRRTKHRSPN